MLYEVITLGANERGRIQGAGEMGVALGAGAGSLSSVITSYSIHYTKLYDYSIADQAIKSAQSGTGKT